MESLKMAKYYAFGYLILLAYSLETGQKKIPIVVLENVLIVLCIVMFQFKRNFKVGK